MQQGKTLTLPTRAGVETAKGSIYFVGTATVIIRYAGFTLLTDPNFLHRGDHVHLGYGLTSKRVTNPAIELEDLPPIDLVILSHFHEDHFDREVERKLHKQLPIVSTPHAVRALSKRGFSSLFELSPWQTLTVNKGESQLTVTAMPGRHAPGILSRVLPPVMGSLLDFSAGADLKPLRMYISGDTLLVDELKEIPQRYPDIHIALLHLGGTRVLGVLVTMDASQGVEAIKLIAPNLTIPIHYNDYTVFKSPLADFMQAVHDAGLEDKVRYLYHGESYEIEL